jgi:hypothetical protein
MVIPPRDWGEVYTNVARPRRIQVLLPAFAETQFAWSFYELRNAKPRLEGGVCIIYRSRKGVLSMTLLMLFVFLIAVLIRKRRTKLKIEIDL